MTKKSATRFEPPQEGRTYYIEKRDVWVNQHNIICKLTNKNKDSLIKRTVYRFTYLENGVRVRLKANEHPVFFSKEEAEAWAKSRTGINQARKDRVKKRQDWERQFVDLSKHPWASRSASGSMQRAR